MNIFNFDRLYRRAVHGKGATGSEVDLILDPVPAGRLRVLTHVTVENITSGFTKCRLAIINGSVVYYIDEIDTVAAEELLISRSDILLGEADRFFARLIGTTTDDTLKMVCIGWEGNI